MNTQLILAAADGMSTPIGTKISGIVMFVLILAIIIFGFKAFFTKTGGGLKKFGMVLVAAGFISWFVKNPDQGLGDLGDLAGTVWDLVVSTIKQLLG